MWSKIEKRLNEKFTQVRLQTYEDIEPTVDKNKKILFITLYHPQKPKKEFQNLSKLLKGPSLGSEYFQVAFLS